MGLMKRVYTHCIENGKSLRGEVRFKRSAFGLDDPPKAKRKSKTKKISTSLPKTRMSRTVDEAMANAERILGRKVTMEDITGKKQK